MYLELLLHLSLQKSHSIWVCREGAVEFKETSGVILYPFPVHRIRILFQDKRPRTLPHWCRSVNEKQHHESEDGVLFTLQMKCILDRAGVRWILYVIVRDDTVSVSINIKTHSKLITSQLIRPQLQW